MEAIMQIELQTDERALLEEILNRSLAEIPIEIHHCKTPDFKAHLKEKQKLIESIAEKLKH